MSQEHDKVEYSKEELDDLELQYHDDSRILGKKFIPIQILYLIFSLPLFLLLAFGALILLLHYFFWIFLIPIYMIVCIWYWEFFNAPAYFHLIHILVKDYLNTKIYAPNPVRVISNKNFDIEPLSLQLCDQFFLADISIYKDQLLLGCTTILNANFIISGLLVMIVVLAFGYLLGYFICIPAFYMRKIKDKKFLQIINILKKHNRI